MSLVRMLKTSAIFLANVEILLVGSLVVLSIVSEIFLPFAVGIGLAFWIIRWGAYGRPSLSTPVSLPLLLLVLLIPLNVYVTPLPAKSLPEVLRLLTGILLFFSLLNWAQSAKRINWLLLGFLALGLALSAAAILIVKYSFKFQFLEKILPNLQSLAFASSVHPNVMAGNLILLLSGTCVFLAYGWTQFRPARRFGLGLAILFIFGIVILTQSRGALIGLAASLCLLILLRFKRGWIPILIVLLLSFVVIYQIGPQRVWNSIVSETGGAVSIDTREEVWMRAKMIIQDFPLTGVGMGIYGDVTDSLYPFAHVAIFVSHAHNLFLQIAVDLGVPGLLFWLAAWLAILTMAWQLYSSRDSFFSPIGAAVLCSMAAMGVHAMLDAVTWDTRPSIIVWGIWGLTAAAWNLHHRSESRIITGQNTSGVRLDITASPTNL